MTGHSGKVKVQQNDDTYDVHSNILQLYIVDIRSIGNCMLIEPKAEDTNRLVRPISVDTFLQKMKSAKDEDMAFQVVMGRNHVVVIRMMKKIVPACACCSTL